MKIGVLSESFRLPVMKAIEEAAKLGLDGLQIYAVGEELNCGRCPAQIIRDIKASIHDHGMSVSAICGDLGGHGFCRADENAVKIDLSKRLVDFARELDTEIITTHIGVIPNDTSCARYTVMQKACAELAQYARAAGAVFAIETGPEPAETLLKFLDTLPKGGIGVNMDPANLVMVTSVDPAAAVLLLRQYIVHTHAKDGLQLRPADPQQVYDFFAEGGIGDLRLEEFFKETPLGEGDVDFAQYFRALKEINYHGFLTIEREVGNHPLQDIRSARDYLKQFL